MKLDHGVPPEAGFYSERDGSYRRNLSRVT